MSASDLGKKLQNIPRWVTAMITIILIVIPLSYPLNIPVKVTGDVIDFYNYIQELPEGSVVALGFDHLGAGHWASTGAACIATVNLILQRPLKLIIWSTNSQGAALFPELLKRITIPEDKKYGVDWVYFGFISGEEAAMAELAYNLRSSGVDYYGNALNKLPVMEGIYDHEQVDLLINNGGGGTWPKFYVRKWVSPYGTPFAMIQTPVNSIMNLPFRASGHIKWVIWGQLGDAELETLLGYSGWGRSNIDAQNLIHLFVIVMVILGNVGYQLERKGRGV